MAGNKRSGTFYETSGGAAGITRFACDGDKVIFTLIRP